MIQSTGVAIPTLDRGLVDADHVHCAKVDQPELALKRTVMDLLSRLANSKPHHDLFDRQPHARGGRISHSQLRRQALVAAIELWHRFDVREDELRLRLDNGQGPHVALTNVIRPQ